MRGEDKDKRFIESVTKKKALDWILEIAADLRDRMDFEFEHNSVEWSFKLMMHEGNLNQDDEISITKESEYDYEVIIKCSRKQKES